MPANWITDLDSITDPTILESFARLDARHADRYAAVVAEQAEADRTEARRLWSRIRGALRALAGT